MRKSAYAGVLVAVVVLGVACGAGGKMVTTGTYGTLAEAAKAGDLGAVVAFVGQGFDVNRPDDSGMAPAHYAALGGHVEILRFLVEEGANPMVRNAEGKTPLQLAQEAGQQAVVELFQSAS